MRTLKEALHSAALQERNKGVIVVKVISDETKYSTIDANMKLRAPIEVIH